MDYRQKLEVRSELCVTILIIRVNISRQSTLLIYELKVFLLE